MTTVPELVNLRFSGTGGLREPDEGSTTAFMGSQQQWLASVLTRQSTAATLQEETGFLVSSHGDVANWADEYASSFRAEITGGSVSTAGDFVIQLGTSVFEILKSERPAAQLQAGQNMSVGIRLAVLRYAFELCSDLNRVAARANTVEESIGVLDQAGQPQLAARLTELYSARCEEVSDGDVDPLSATSVASFVLFVLGGLVANSLRLSVTPNGNVLASWTFRQHDRLSLEFLGSKQIRALDITPDLEVLSGEGRALYTGSRSYVRRKLEKSRPLVVIPE